MNNRAHIVVQNLSQNSNYIYYDGNDGGLDDLGKDLKKFLRNLIKISPKEITPGYISSEISKWNPKCINENTGIHGDENFVYRISLNNYDEKITIQVYSRGSDWDLPWLAWDTISEYTEIFSKPEEKKEEFLSKPEEDLYFSGYFDGKRDTENYPSETYIREVLRLSWEAENNGIYDGDGIVRYIVNNIGK